MHDIFELKRREEAKRDSVWDARERWRVLQETISWAEAQIHPPRNSPQVCIRLEARLNAGIRSCSQSCGAPRSPRA